MRAIVHLWGYDDDEVELTDEHATSSYGLPVVLIDGQSYGPLEMALTYPGYVLTIGWQRPEARASEVLTAPTLDEDVLYPQVSMAEELSRLATAYEMLRRAKVVGYRVG